VSISGTFPSKRAAAGDFPSHPGCDGSHRGVRTRGRCGERGKASIAFDATRLVDIGLPPRSASGGLCRTQKRLPRSGGAFSWKRRAPRRTSVACAPGASISAVSISRGAGLAGTLRLRLSGPMAVGVISARADIRHHAAIVTGNSPPMMAALPRGRGLTCVACTLSTVPPVGGVRSRCHEQRNGTQQHQQTLHDRLLPARMGVFTTSSSSSHASYDDARRHHRAGDWQGTSESPGARKEKVLLYADRAAALNVACWSNSDYIEILSGRSAEI
jgi:hypothetical protein